MGLVAFRSDGWWPSLSDLQKEADLNCWFPSAQFTSLSTDWGKVKQTKNISNRRLN